MSFVFCSSSNHHHHLLLPFSRSHGLLPIKASVHLPSQPPSPTATAATSTATSTATERISRSKNRAWLNPDSPRKSRLSLLASSLDSSDLSHIPSLISSASPPLSPADLRHLLPLLTSTAPILPLFYHFLSHSPPRGLPLPDFNRALRQAITLRHWPTAESLLLLLLSHGLQPNTTTLSLAVSCALACRIPDRAAYWFDRLTALGCTPDAYTYSSMIRTSHRDMALSLYDQALPFRSSLHPAAFSAIIRFHALSGDMEGALGVFEEMKALGVTPNVVVYNTLFKCLGLSNRPDQAKEIFAEMISAGVAPLYGTYVVLFRAFARAKYKDDAFHVYHLMKENGMPLSGRHYNRILILCSRMGLVDEALAMFADMLASGAFQESSFRLLFNLLSHQGRLADAEATLERMEAAGIPPDTLVMTTMIRLYGKAGMTDKIMEVFDRMSKLGIPSDERMYRYLLHSMIQTPKEDLEVVAKCVELADARLGVLVKDLIGRRGGDSAFLEEAEQILVRRSKHRSRLYCKFLIHLCVQLDLPEVACSLLELAVRLDVFGQLQFKSASQWSLQLRNLSRPVMLMGLRLWMNDLSRAMEAGEELPPSLGVRPSRSNLTELESLLMDLNAPFLHSDDMPGWFLSTNTAVETWLRSRNSC